MNVCTVDMTRLRLEAVCGSENVPIEKHEQRVGASGGSCHHDEVE